MKGKKLVVVVIVGCGSYGGGVVGSVGFVSGVYIVQNNTCKPFDRVVRLRSAKDSFEDRATVLFFEQLAIDVRFMKFIKNKYFKI